MPLPTHHVDWLRTFATEPVPIDELLREASQRGISSADLVAASEQVGLATIGERIRLASVARPRAVQALVELTESRRAVPDSERTADRYGMYRGLGNRPGLMDRFPSLLHKPGMEQRAFSLARKFGIGREDFPLARRAGLENVRDY